MAINIKHILEMKAEIKLCTSLFSVVTVPIIFPLVKVIITAYASSRVPVLLQLTSFP